MGRKIYIDLGANNGETVKKFMAENPGYIAFAFEPTPALATKIREMFKGPDSRVHLMECAAWVSDGIINFYFGTTDVSSTVLEGKAAPIEWGVDYASPYRAQSIDFDRWFRENTSDDDQIVLKMDIEGAEYKVLRRLLDSGAIKRIKDLRVEWHWDRYPLEVTKAVHDDIRHRVSLATKLTDWG